MAWWSAWNPRMGKAIMAGHRSVTKRRVGGSRFRENRLTLRQRVVAAERLARKSGGKLSTAQALKQVNKAQADREKRIKKRRA